MQYCFEHVKLITLAFEIGSREWKEEDAVFSLQTSVRRDRFEVCTNDNCFRCVTRHFVSRWQLFDIAILIWRKRSSICCHTSRIKHRREVLYVRKEGMEIFFKKISFNREKRENSKRRKIRNLIIRIYAWKFRNYKFQNLKNMEVSIIKIKFYALKISRLENLSTL